MYCLMHGLERGAIRSDGECVQGAVVPYLPSQVAQLPTASSFAEQGCGCITLRRRSQAGVWTLWSHVAVLISSIAQV